MNMKTILIFLACLLVLTAGDTSPNTKKKKECDNKAAGIALQDCKKHCSFGVTEGDCIKCVGTHRDFDYADCTDLSVAMVCDEISLKLKREDCKEQCELGTCIHCIANHKDYGLPCLMAYYLDA